MNYKSPIQVNVIDEMVETLQKEQETAVGSLQYDRDQYIKGYADGYNKAKAALERRRPTGCWVGIDEEPHEQWECSNCGNILDTYWEDELEKHKYCHQCGAIMSVPWPPAERGEK